MPVAQVAALAEINDFGSTTPAIASDLDWSVAMLRLASRNRPSAVQPCWPW